MKTLYKGSIGVLLSLMLSVLSASAVAEPLDPTTSYLFNSFLLLICGVLVMFMAAGFAMLEAGSVQVKSVSTILIKNVALYSISGIMFYLVGYNLMFAENNALFGVLSHWQATDSNVLSGDISKGMADNAFWFFQMVFVATAASVVSGALAERVKLWSFLLFVVLLTGFIYPVVGHWTWGGGWLSQIGFSDFAGSTIVHSVGGWAALAGAILLGARDGRFLSNGAKVNLPNSSSPQVAIGVFILWFGWFGFNGGSQLAFQSIEDAIAISTIFVNTNAAAAGGLLAVLIVTQIMDGKPNLMATLNGALAGLVSITADPISPQIGSAILIGATGGFIMLAASMLLERFKIDDAVGAIPVHLAAGIWGTLIVAASNPQASFSSQLIGVLAIGAFVFIVSFIIWCLLKITTGIRLCRESEKSGADMTEIGSPAYNL